MASQYVGLDVHKKTIYGYVMDKEGNKLFEKEFKTDPYDMDLFLLNVVKDDSIVAIESCSCWQYAYDYLHDDGYTVELAHPVGIAALKKLRKHTDRHDAILLADLLRTNMLPKSYAAPNDIRVKRQITRHRSSLTNILNEVQNKIHAILLRHGYDVPFTDAFCKSALKYLHDINLPACDRLEIDQYIEILKLLVVKKNECTESIEEIASDDPAIRIAMTMPGMGYFNATAFVGEVGDIRRFASGDKLTSFTGIVPRVHQSGEKTTFGSITKQGSNNLRHVIIQAANVAVQHDKLLKKVYLKFAHKGHNKAIVAVARKMVTLLYVMLKNNIEYRALQIHKAS
ncbi:TPA: IS110 family transposase [Candidatus Woesearchaeota archaeon]|nr:IS110 family transposase [Candidatus Woesearchaeota archaeon]